MMSVLKNRAYRHMFGAQVVALIGTGLLTVALGLLAYDLAGPNAGVVLGTALAIKMIAYIGVGPIANAFADRLPRRPLLVSLDLIRATIALLLPFVSEVWQIYILIFVLQSASAAFTPTFQATIPDLLPDEKDYTRALSLARLAYDLESLASPVIAAALLTVISFNLLFVGTVAGFLLSAALVVSVALPRPKTKPREGGMVDRTTYGLRLYLKTPRLRALLAFSLSAAAAGAFVFVNNVVYVRTLLGKGENDVPVSLAAFGTGSIVAALVLPKLLGDREDRPVMLVATLLMVITLTGMAVVTGFHLLPLWPSLVVGLFILGIGYCAAQLPSGRLIRRSGDEETLSALFAAQFALSHACWLVTYSLSGWIGAAFGLVAALLAMAGLALIGFVFALWLWPTEGQLAKRKT
ncbi:MFS transporter [Asticcacaulis sp. W401b]|uniref:MFS transporter n=1 Tax=Asticcacaulis sp. W401b TaxID=3388666 RepID=UPI00397099E3